MKRRALLLSGAAFAATVLAACGEESAPVEARPTATRTLASSAASGTRAVTDMAGREVRLPDTARRVVAISPSTVAFALELGLELLGRPSDAPQAAAQAAPTVGTTLAPDFPAIAQRAPDLVLADAAFHGSRLKDFDAFPYPVYVVNAASYRGVLDALTGIGEATGESTRAAAAVAEIEGHVAAVRERIAALPAPGVLILTGGGREIYAGSDSTYLGDLVRVLGATNVLGDTPQGAPIAGFGLVEPGELARLDPDVVLVIAAGQGGLADEIRRSPEWTNTTAVRNGAIYELDTATYLRSPGPDVDDTIEALAALVYGEATRR